MRKYQIIYEDKHIIAVNKPPGELVIPGSGKDREQGSIVDNLNKYLNTVLFTVHRLDRETTGVLLFAKNPESHRELCKLFERRKIKKIYWGVVYGETPLTGSINIPLHKARKGKMRPAKISEPKSLRALTHFRTIASNKNVSLVEIYPVTGRHHQVRVHFRAIGHPFLLDKFYGKIIPKEVREEFSKLVDRFLLHVVTLKFKHPFKNKFVEIKAQLPPDFKKVIEYYNLSQITTIK